MEVPVGALIYTTFKVPIYTGFPLLGCFAGIIVSVRDVISNKLVSLLLGSNNLVSLLFQSNNCGVF